MGTSNLKMLKIDAKFQVNGKWSPSESDFKGRILIDEEDNFFEGIMNEKNNFFNQKGTQWAVFGKIDMSYYYSNSSITFLAIPSSEAGKNVKPILCAGKLGNHSKNFLWETLLPFKKSFVYSGKSEIYLGVDYDSLEDTDILYTKSAIKNQYLKIISESSMINQDLVKNLKEFGVPAFLLSPFGFN